MYADRYAQPTRFNPGGLTAAVGINLALVAALMFAGPKILPGATEHVLVTENIPIAPPPPPLPDPEPVESPPHRTTEMVYVPTPPVPTPDTSSTIATTTLTPTISGPIVGTDPGPVVDAPVAPPAPLPLVGPAIDPRYADDFQPAYPAIERRANRDGHVTVRVLVGADGRVKQIEQVTATSDAFWQATRERALKAWRFRPATRGSVPVEAWRTMTLTFRMKD